MVSTKNKNLETKHIFQYFDIVNTHNSISSYSALNSTTTQPRQLKKGSHIKPVGTNMAQHQDNLFQYTRKQSQSFFFHAEEVAASRYADDDDDDVGRVWN